MPNASDDEAILPQPLMIPSSTLSQYCCCEMHYHSKGKFNEYNTLEASLRTHIVV